MKDNRRPTSDLSTRFTNFGFLSWVLFSALVVPHWSQATDCFEALEVLNRTQVNGDPVIIGGGPVGSNLAIRLSDLGFQPVVLEKRPDPRINDPESGRTFNITLATRGFAAVSDDVRENLQSKTVPCRGRALHCVDGTQIVQPFGHAPEHQIYAISRTELNKTLVNAASEKGVVYLFNTNISDVDLSKGTMDLQFINGKTTTVPGVPIRQAIGTDGANSTLRPAIAAASGTNERTMTLSSGFKAFHFPGLADGRPVFEPGLMHHWPREDIVVTGIPNRDGSTSLLLVVPLAGPLSFARLETPMDYQRLFQENFPDLLEMNPQLPSLLHSRPLSTVRRAEADQWNFGKQYLVMGDAAHAMSYYFGQGTNVGLEDTTYFSKMVAETGIDSAIENFGANRKPKTDVIQDLSDGNHKMLTKAAISPEFNFRLKLELELAKRFPDYFRLRYEYVVFSTMDFTIAQQRMGIQEGIMDQITAGHPNSLDHVNWNNAEKLIRARLTPITH